MDHRLSTYNTNINYHNHHIPNNMSSNNKTRRRVKRLSGGLNHSTSGSSLTSAAMAVNPNSYYYPSHFISKPCDQLFGPVDPATVFMSSVTSGDNYVDREHERSREHGHHHHYSNQDSVGDDGDGGGGYGGGGREQVNHNTSLTNEEKFEYIPTPKWSKLQNSILEELYKKTRYPKAHELKVFAQRFHVMDCDIEV
jgi:hypothetical protein